MRRLLTLVTLLAVLAVPGVARADSTISYDSSTSVFVYTGSDGTSTADLFESFKGVMPGDVLSETITIVNASESLTPERLYLKSGGSTATEDELLERLTLTVESVEGEQLFVVNGTQSEGADEWCELGVVAPGGSVSVLVTLEVPIELESRFMSTSVQVSSESLTWSFGVEEVSWEEYEALLAGEAEDGSGEGDSEEEDGEGDDSSITEVWNSKTTNVTRVKNVINNIVNVVSGVYAKTADALGAWGLVALLLLIAGFALVRRSRRA